MNAAGRSASALDGFKKCVRNPFFRKEIEDSLGDDQVEIRTEADIVHARSPLRKQPDKRRQRNFRIELAELIRGFYFY